MEFDKEVVLKCFDDLHAPKEVTPHRGWPILAFKAMTSPEELTKSEIFDLGRITERAFQVAAERQGYSTEVNAFKQWMQSVLRKL